MIPQRLMTVARQSSVVSTPAFLLGFTNTKTVSLSYDNGETWSQVVTDAPHDLQRGEACKDYVLATCYKAGTGLVLMKSTNGVNWTVIADNIPSASRIANAFVAYDGTGFALLIATATTNVQRIFYSTDCVSWTPVYGLTSRSYASARILSSGNFLSVYRANTGEILQVFRLSDNLYYERASTSLGFGTTYYGVGGTAWFNNYLIAYGSQGRRIATSPNGNGTFTSRLSNATNDAFNDHAVVADRVLIGGSTQSNVPLLYSSTNGESWGGITLSGANGLGSSGAVSTMIEMPNHALIIGSNGIVCRTYDGIVIERIGNMTSPWTTHSVVSKPAS